MNRRVVAATVGALALLFGAPMPAAAAADVDHWAMEFLHVREANAITQGAGIIVAVLDTGVDPTHPDLAGSVLPGYNPEGVGPADGTTEVEGHGTAMAGLIAAHGSMYGVAPQAKILPIRAKLSTSQPKAIDWAVDHGAQVINVSQGSSDSSQLRAAVTRAINASVVIVASAGNTPTTTKVEGLGTYDGVITVAGVTRTGVRVESSLRSASVVLAAPGEGLDATWLGGAYHTGTGTSDAAALVSGVAALMKAKFPNLSAQEIVHRMTATADDKGPPGRDDEYGYGIVNPVKALTADVPPLATTAAPNGSSTGTGQGDTGGGGLSGILIAAIIAAGGVLVLVTIGIVLATRRRA